MWMVLFCFGQEGVEGEVNLTEGGKDKIALEGAGVRECQVGCCDFYKFLASGDGIRTMGDRGLQLSVDVMTGDGGETIVGGVGVGAGYYVYVYQAVDVGSCGRVAVGGCGYGVLDLLRGFEERPGGKVCVEAHAYVEKFI